MRIRKRQVPFPLFPVTPSSDPNLINRSPVLVQLTDATTTSPKLSCTHASTTAPIPLLDHPQPSDQPLPPIGKPIHGCDDFSSEAGAQRKQHKEEEYLVEGGGEGQKGNDTRKGSILCSEMQQAEIFSPSSPSSSKQDGRWCEGDKAFPPKKRRGSFENVIEDGNNDNSKKKMKIKSRMKTKMNKKYLGQDDSNEWDQEEEDNKEEEVMIKETTHDVNVGKKRVRGGALMEGSRCSRVNGRGWRCCQQTLVGYSLCEHHLGKGRLRSMTSVRSRSIATTNAAPKNNLQDMPLSEPSSSSLLEKQTKCVTLPSGNDTNDNHEKKPLMITKRRMKLGMVKARSISSLLGQTNTEIALAENNK